VTDLNALAWFPEADRPPRTQPETVDGPPLLTLVVDRGPVPVELAPVAASPAVEAERRLLVRCRAGDRFAFAEIYDAHRADLLSFASRRVARTVDPEDVVHEAFLATMDAIRKGLGPREGIRPYLFTAVRRRSISANEGARRVILQDSLAWLEDPTIVESVGGEEAVVEALRSLPARWQLALVRTEVQGYGVQAVAEELGLSPNAASALVYRARVGLRRAYLDAPHC